MVALVTLLSVPVATNAGEWLERRVPDDPLVRAHVRLGDSLLPWVVGLVLVSAANWAVNRSAARSGVAGEPVRVGAGKDPSGVRETSPLTGPAARIVLAVLAVLIAAGSIGQVYRIGESGARAAWHSAVQQDPTGGGED